MRRTWRPFSGEVSAYASAIAAEALAEVDIDAVVEEALAEADAVMAEADGQVAQTMAGVATMASTQAEIHSDPEVAVTRGLVADYLVGEAVEAHDEIGEH